jgi:methyl-accepting chemotaxis protein
MNWFYDRKISTKLLTGFIVVAFIAGLIGFIGIRNIRQTDENYSQMYAHWGISLGYLGEAAVALQRTRVNMQDVLLDPAHQGNYIAAMRNEDKIIDADLAKYEKSLQTATGKDNFQQFIADLANYRQVRERILRLAAAGQTAQALNVLNNEARPLSDKLDKLVDMQITEKTTTGLATSAKYSQQTNSTVNTMAIGVFAAVILAIALGSFIARTISKPLKRLTGAAGRIAEGDLAVEVEVSGKDEVGLLAGAFQRMADKVHEVMREINMTSEQVAAAARQVSESGQALAQGSTEQAASSEELTASMEEIAGLTKQNAVNANQANELSASVKADAEHGNQQMQSMLHAMEEINESSSNISKIIKVIDEIAFQTNILALNAAVEAARAGQHGKGFAVVAEEVRNLAARSADAAKETTVMIEGSIRKVEAGTKLAGETAQALNRIVDGIAKAAGLVTGIAVASNEQATGIAQVNQGIMQVSQVTQTNSATAEESASASEELSTQAEMLRKLVGTFKLRNNGRRVESVNETYTDFAKLPERMDADRRDGGTGRKREAKTKIVLEQNEDKY